MIVMMLDEGAGAGVARRMSLHHGLTDLCNNHFTDSFILAWFQASSQASLRFCLWGPLTSK